MQTDEKLKEISEAVFGEKAELRLVPVESISLLEKNARYMTSQTFGMLSKNIKGDGFLSSVPLCVEENGKLVVLSGNHRVKASKESGLKSILVIVDKRDMSDGHKKAIALSHNALVGNDDAEMLKAMWSQIDALADKEYAGLDSKSVDNLIKTASKSFNAIRVPTKQLVFWFLPADLEYIEKVLDDASLITGDVNIVASQDAYQRLVELIIKTKKGKNIKNSALALERVIQMAEDKMKESE